MISDAVYVLPSRLQTADGRIFVGTPDVDQRRRYRFQS